MLLKERSTYLCKAWKNRTFLGWWTNLVNMVNVCYMYDVDSIVNVTVDKSQCRSQCARRTMIR